MSIMFNQIDITEEMLPIIRSPMGSDHLGKRIYACYSYNAKLFERIEHSGIW